MTLNGLVKEEIQLLDRHVYLFVEMDLSTNLNNVMQVKMRVVYLIAQLLKKDGIVLEETLNQQQPVPKYAKIRECLSVMKMPSLLRIRQIQQLIQEQSFLQFHQL